jgi:hypothetical protein
MSRDTALANISLMPSAAWAHAEYSLECQGRYARRLTGEDVSTPAGARALYNAWAVDFLWRTNDGIYDDWLRHGRATDMGHAEYQEGGVDRREPAACPFSSVQEVWAFDPVAEYGLPGFEEQVQAYNALDLEARETYPGQLTTGGYYKTMVSGAIQAFGWDLFLEAAADRARIETLFDRFFQRTLFHMRAWAESSADVLIQHDDFVWTAGPFMHPDIYRRVLIPRYAELWKPVHAAGKKLLFCSDGNFMDFADDIVEAGADGLIFEPCNDFGFMAERFGDSRCLVGSCVDCRDLTFGLADIVARDMERTFNLLETCRGAVVAVGNHLPANIPEDMLDCYIGALRQRLPRRGSASCP